MTSRRNGTAPNAPQAARPGAELVRPYGSGSRKGEEVERMFDAIAPSYDVMNTAMSLGMHRRWRRRALDAAAAMLGSAPADVLDVATGTGDVAFGMHSLWPEAAITGIDLSEGMLAVARRKLAAMPPEAAAEISFMQADSLCLPFAEGSFDLVTVAYGVRNFERLADGYREMHRVLRPGGVICVIELSEPPQPLLKAGYRLYSRTLIPLAGRIVSGDRRAYSYLPESIAACPQRGAMTALMEEAGFRSAAWRSLAPGAVTYYTARK